jgi:hypothetical protein
MDLDFETTNVVCLPEDGEMVPTSERQNMFRVTSSQCYVGGWGALSSGGGSYG